MPLLDKYYSLPKYKKIFIELAILILIAAYLRPIPSVKLMGRDETSYAFLIKHFVDGTFLDDYILIAFHPFFSFISAPIAAMGVNPELAGRIVSYVCGVLSVIPVYFIGDLLLSKTVGFIAAFLTATSPLLIKWSGIVQAQTTYSFMLICSFLFIILFFQKSKYRYAILAGIFMSFAYLSRAEGLGIFVGNIVLFVIHFFYKKGEIKKVFVGLWLFIFSFLIIASPYIYVLRSKTGETKFTNKLYTQIRAAVIASYELDYEKYNYGNAEIPKNELMKMAFKAYPKKIIESLRNFPDYFGILAVSMFILSLILLFFTPAFYKSFIYFIPYLYVLFILPFFFVAENYFIPYAPFIFLISGFWVERLNNFFKEKLNKNTFTVIIVSIVFLLAYENVLHNRIIIYFKDSKPTFDLQSIIYTGYRDFGREVSKLIKPNSKIMTRFNIGAWYAGGEYVSFPDVDWAKFLESLKNQKVDYIIIGPAEMGMRSDIYNELIWRIKGIIKDTKFNIVHRLVNNNYLEFYLIKVEK